MPNPEVAPYLPIDVWEALATVNDFLEIIPVPRGEKASFIEFLEKFTVTLVATSKKHHLNYDENTGATMARRAAMAKSTEDKIKRLRKISDVS